MKNKYFIRGCRKFEKLAAVERLIYIQRLII